MAQNKAAVFILLGQSNAVGHGVPMEPRDVIREPMKNVFGLSREENQSFENRALVWSGYTSFGMNLAETQDNTYSVANCLAALWQDHIDSGNAFGLPDLYIVQIAIGAQGVTRQYMWHPDRAEKLIPGKLGTVDISLYPYCMHHFSLLEDSFRALGMDYEIIGLHWRGGENDTSTDRKELEAELLTIYERIFDGFDRVLDQPPVVLHRLVCRERMTDQDPTGKKLENMDFVNSVFEKLAEKRENVRMFDVRQAPCYRPGIRCDGLFMKDAVHFTPEVNRWVAFHILDEYRQKTTGNNP